jgi:hypothetical protein
MAMLLARQKREGDQRNTDRTGSLWKDGKICKQERKESSGGGSRI